MQKFRLKNGIRLRMSFIFTNFAAQSVANNKNHLILNYYGKKST